MFLLQWYKEWLEIRAEFKQRKVELSSEVKKVEVCESCETLKEQLEKANYREQQLLNRLLEKPEKVEERVVAPEPLTRPGVPRFMPWKVRQQMLEKEDREKARSLSRAAKPDKERTESETEKVEIAELEKELDIASETREGQAAS